MSKTLSRQELVEKSKAIFADRTEDELFATSDGQFFILKDRRNMHAKSGEFKTYDIKRSEVETTPAAQEVTDEDDQLTVDQIKALIKEEGNVEVLKELLADEAASAKPRKTAIAAIEARIEELVEPSTPEQKEVKTHGDEPTNEETTQKETK